MPDETATLDLKPEDTVRVYVDISRECELKVKLRCIAYQRETGHRCTRKEYLEKLIEEDVAKVRGASLREINRAKK